MDVVCTSEIDEAEYERFLDGFAPRPGVALAYHYPFYLRFLADVAYPGSAIRFVVSRSAHGGLAGVMPGLQLRAPHLNAWLSLAYFGPNAGALVDAAGMTDGVSTTRGLVAAALADARDRGCGSMTVCTPLRADAMVYQGALGRADFDLARTSQCLTLPDDPHVSPWPRKVRYDIRRAASLGVTVRAVETEAELDAVWDIYRTGCEDAGIPMKPLAHVRCLYRTAGARGVCLAAEHAGEIIGGLIAFMGGGVLSYYLPCSRADKRSLQPGLALLDRAVAIARSAGCRLLNFESSPGPASSVFKFKARCGAEPVDYHVMVKLLRAGVLDELRALGRDGVSREAPQAFIVPFEALA
jgi:hypothetical protein